MEEAVRQRINEYIKSKRYSINALSKLLEVNQRTLNNQLSGNSALSVNIICAILDKFPELSAEWLLRGKEERATGLNTGEDTKYIKMLEAQLEEEKLRNRGYWDMIQELVKK